MDDYFVGVAVYASSDEPFESLLKRFNRLVDRLRILREYRDNQTYVKPSDARRRKLLAARLKEKKRQQKEL